VTGSSLLFFFQENTPQVLQILQSECFGSPAGALAFSFMLYNIIRCTEPLAFQVIKEDSTNPISWQEWVDTVQTLKGTNSGKTIREIV
jgi:hypothetical protein